MTMRLCTVHTVIPARSVIQQTYATRLQERFLDRLFSLLRSYVEVLAKVSTLVADYKQPDPGRSCLGSGVEAYTSLVRTWDCVVVEPGF